MTQWVTFTAIVTLLTAAMVGLSLLTQRSMRPVRADATFDEPHESGASVGPASPSSAEPGLASDRSDTNGPALETESVRRSFDAEPDRRDTKARSGREPADGTPPAGSTRRGRGPQSTPPARGAGRVVASVGGEPVTTRGLLVNVTVTQALFLGLVVAAAVLADVPISALGIASSGPGLGSGLALGLGAGLGLYAASEVGGELGRRVGIDHDEWLRESLAPTSRAGWVALFVGVLPLIAVFEELLFRGVLIGAVSVGFGLSQWPLAVASSILFAVGHGIQGTAGIVVTGVIGFVLAGIFVVTGSLLTVVVAHYVLNACEFAVHEGLGIDPLRSSRGD